jgi:GMP reductase
MKIEPDIKLDFSDVLIRPKRSTLSSRSEVDLVRDFKFPHSPQTLSCVPIIVANMDTTGTVEMLKAASQHKILTCLHKYVDVNELIKAVNETPDIINYCFLSTGIRDHDWEKVQNDIELLEKNSTPIRMLVIDVANGYMISFANFCKKVREKYPKLIIMAGNVCSREITEELILNCGVDIVKCGIGPGSCCKTRTQTGCGIPQLSCVSECSESSHGVNAHVCGDGGITCPGDLAKCFGAGSDFAMCGGIFSGHEESGGKIIEENGKKYKLFYGMSSEKAMQKYSGGMAKHRSSEGKCVKIPYKGSVHDTILDFLGGLRSTCTYVGARKIKHLPKCTTFVRVNNQINNIYK